MGVSFAVGAYGIVANRVLVSAVGLCAVAVIGSGMALVARAGMRRVERRCQMLGRARAESERARHDLEVENAELRRRNIQLEAQHAAIVDGLDWVDAHAAGRLRALLDSAGLELADLADMVLDDEEDA